MCKYVRVFVYVCTFILHPLFSYSSLYVCALHFDRYPECTVHGRTSCSAVSIGGTCQKTRPFVFCLDTSKRSWV